MIFWGWAVLAGFAGFWAGIELMERRFDARCASCTGGKEGEQA